MNNFLVSGPGHPPSGWPAETPEGQHCSQFGAVQVYLFPADSLLEEDEAHLRRN